MPKISFYRDYSFDPHSIKFLQGAIGIYFIFLTDLEIPYPFGRSRLVYIGVSEATQNSIGGRLRDHLMGISGNVGIKNYAERFHARFTYHTLQVLEALGTRDLFELEAFFLGRFVRDFGCYPICNNQSGQAVGRPLIKEDAAVDWSYFG